MTTKITVNPALIRIGLRYVAGALVAKGVINAEAATALQSNAQLIAMLTTVAGGIVAVATEGIYALAKRFGWRT